MADKTVIHPLGAVLRNGIVHPLSRRCFKGNNSATAHY